jgi:hypothetical protein
MPEKHLRGGRTIWLFYYISKVIAFSAEAGRSLQSFTPGFAFGRSSNTRSQAWLVLEAGVIF